MLKFVTVKSKSQQSHLKTAGFPNSLNLDTLEACKAVANLYETSQSLEFFEYAKTVGNHQPTLSVISNKKIGYKEFPNELCF